MIGLQMLVNIPDWARERGLDEYSFNILEQVVLSPELKDRILAKVEYGTACAILNALEYAQGKDLLN